MWILMLWLLLLLFLCARANTALNIGTFLWHFLHAMQKQHHMLFPPWSCLCVSLSSSCSCRRASTCSWARTAGSTMEALYQMSTRLETALWMWGSRWGALHGLLPCLTPWTNKHQNNHDMNALFTIDKGFIVARDKGSRIVKGTDRSLSHRPYP